MKDLLINYIGVYTPPAVDGVPLSGAAGIDWTWLASAALLIVGVWCVCAIIGAIIKRGGK